MVLFFQGRGLWLSLGTLPISGDVLGAKTPDATMT